MDLHHTCRLERQRHVYIPVTVADQELDLNSLHLAFLLNGSHIFFNIHIHVNGETHEIRKYSICMHKGRRYARYSQDGIFHPGETNNIKGYLYAIKPNYFKIFSSSGIKFLLNNLDDHVGCLQRQ